VDTSEETRRRWRPRHGADLVAARDSLLAVEARIRADFKRAVAAGLIAFACLVAGDNLGDVHRAGHKRYVALGLAAIFAVSGAMAVRSAAREVQKVSAPRAGLAAASTLRVVCSTLGYLLVALGVLQLLSVNTRSLLVGGAVTGVVLGIAAQQSLGNFFAGLVLLLARPYVPGQRVVIRSGALGGPFVGTITNAGLIYTTIVTEDGPINLPNSGLLAAAIGPAHEPPHVEPEQEPDDGRDEPEPAEPQHSTRRFRRPRRPSA
jgi:small-conductance mechanosensitive channel